MSVPREINSCYGEMDVPQLEVLAGSLIRMTKTAEIVKF